jgi:hypothetical protein
MKKSIKFGGRKRFDKGGVARSSDGELIRFGYEDDDEYQKRVNADKAAQGRTKDVEFSGRTTTRKAVEDAIDATDEYNAGLKINQVKPPPAPLPSPSKTESQPSKTYSEYDVEEPGSAGFSRTPLKQKPKPAKKKEETSKPPAGAFRGTRSEGGNYKPSAVPDESKAPSTGGFTKKSPKRESMFSSGNTKLRDITEGRMPRFAKGGSVGSASKRADGIAQRGKTRGMMR